MSLTTTLSASASVVLVAEVPPSTIFNSAAVDVTVVPLIAKVSISAVPSRNKLRHCCEELPKSYASSVLGIIELFTSAPNTTLSEAESPSVNVPPLNVVVPVTVRLPPTATLPVVVILSINASLKYKELVPKSTSLSVTGRKAPS